MTAGRQALYWLGVIAAFIVILAVLGDILLPFVAGMAIAYLLDPLTDRIEAWGAPRGLATTVVLLVSFVLFISALFLLLPLLQDQLTLLLKQLPGIIDRLRAAAETLMATVNARAGPEDVERIRAALTQMSEGLIGALLGVVKRIWSSGLALINLFGLLVITPVVAWYLLRDWDRLVERIDSWLPRDHADVIREQMREIDRTLAGFVRGQAVVCLILGIYYAVALTLLGLDYGLIVGLIAGAISFVPYVGAIVGGLLSIGLAFVQFGAFGPVLIAGAIFFAGQAVEGNYLTPKLVGERVGLHAVWVIFALLAGGSLFGFTGVLVAVPAGAAIGVVARYTLARYLKSPLYLGRDRTSDEP